MTELQLLEV